ncbi:hypothetical protein ASD97_39275 [Streptomyces sp. Root63]|nr:hypothetical protein ASD29_00145 [Streptomyces sp. Root1295]KRA45847.1 hypothetical protein ASD97_39275 [Streptomyces sp. Root63]
MFTDFTTVPRAGEAVTELVRMSREEPVPNRYIERLQAGELTMDGVTGLVGVTHKCHPAEITGFASVMARFPTRSNTEFLANMIHLINRAGPKLDRVIAAVGLDEQTLARWPQDPRAWEVASFWGRMALLGTAAQAALALYWDMANYFPDSDRMLDLLADSGLPVPEEFTWYYSGGQSDELERQALLVVEEGIAAGESTDDMVFAARQMQEAIGGYWEAAARSRPPAGRPPSGRPARGI